MKKLKLKLQNIEGAEMLSREQLKSVMGGSGGGGGGGAGYCAISTSCNLYVRDLGTTYEGKCYYQIGGKCFCGVEVNGRTYTTDPNTTSVCYKEW
ncbi:MAG: hypothetical protein ACTHLE_26885 [Agriterribacter sp.]